MDKQALDLLGQCVATNVDAAAHTSNLLLEAKDQDIRVLSKALLDLVDGLEQMPPMSRPVYIDHLIGRAHASLILAERSIFGDGVR